MKFINGPYIDCSSFKTRGHLRFPDCMYNRKLGLKFETAKGERVCAVGQYTG